MGLSWRGIVLYFWAFSTIEKLPCPSRHDFSFFIVGEKDSEGFPFSGRKWWCNQNFKENPVTENILYASMIIMYLRTNMGVRTSK